MVLNAYIDESYVANGNYYVGVLLVDPNASSHIRNGLDSLAKFAAARHGIPDTCEFHGHSLFQMQDDWSALRNKPNTAASLYNAALKVIASSNGLLFFHGVDTAKLRLAYQKPHDPHIIALQYVLERVQEYAVKHDVRINVIADQVHDQYHHEQRIKLFQQVGTMGYKRSKLERINLPFDWSDSRSHRNLQAIDLAVFIHRRKFAHVETNQLSAQAVAKLNSTIDPIIKHQQLWVPQLKREITLTH